MLKTNRSQKRSSVSVQMLILLGFALLLLVEQAIGNDTPASEDSASRSPAVAERPDDDLAESNARSGSFLELGFAIGDSRSVSRYFDSKSFFASAYLTGVFRWRALFAEADVLEGEYIGATLWQGKRWGVDLIAASAFGELNPEEKETATTDAERSELLYERSSLVVASGFRLSHYSGPRMWRFQLLGDIYKSHGFGATMHFGQQWQFGNWDTRALLGVSWLSDRTADYLFGIDADEATSTLPAVDIGSTALLELGVSAAYPLSRSWVVHADVFLNLYEGSIKRSALVDRNRESVAVVRIGYVF